MKKNILISLVFISVLSFNSHAQKAQLAAADKEYDNYAYIDAIKTYERVVAKGYKSLDLFQKLGNSYYFNSNLEKSAKWYGEMFAMNSVLESEYYYRYAQSLKAINQNDKATEILEKFYLNAENDNRAKLLEKNRNYLEEITANSGRYNVEDAGINSKYSDFGSSIYNNRILFASSRDEGNLEQKHKWTNQNFTNIYTATLDNKMTSSKIDKFPKIINSKFNESTPVFTKNGKTMYFTRNNFLDGKKGKDDKNVTLLKIYKATFKNNKWINVTELPFDSDQYSTAHPALSPDEKTLFFVSDMPGTLGQSDIFKVRINDDGTFGFPENLGNIINTEGKETFPSFTNENELYFASDGHPGLGGLDVFVAKADKEGSFEEVENVGDGINSSKDDFAYLIDTKSRAGFFTSNRDGGQGFDDIYKFLETKKLLELNGNITDLESGIILPNAKVSLLNNKFVLINSTITDAKGNYTFPVEFGKTYNVRVENQDYTTKEQKIATKRKNGKPNLSFVLEKEVYKVTVGDDLGKYFQIKTIYFDLDKSNIRVKAVLDLEIILDVLNQNPTMKLEIRSHTDSRESYKYNEILSQQRAKSTLSWLVKNGIDAKRLTPKGYGETQLVNKCADGVKCSEEEHQQNRRSEFIVKAL